MTDYVASASIDINAPPESVWHTLTDLDALKEIMFGSTVETTWEVGSPIVYRGEWEGNAFEDHGVIVEFDEPRALRTTHFSPMSGEPDVPENYHPLEWLLDQTSAGTTVTINQANNSSQDAADHSAENWRTTLETLKRLTEAS